MALVLRKVGITKNMSILKCIKGKHFVTANKQHPAALSSVKIFRRTKTIRLMGNSMGLRTVKLMTLKMRQRAKLRFQNCSVSCPNLSSKETKLPLVRHQSLPRCGVSAVNGGNRHSVPPYSVNTYQVQIAARRGYAVSCGCPCPPPCGPFGDPRGCNCLPPPCDCPPKCVQYMTGYFYYPYGTWFCGPFHVKNTCVPIKCKDPGCPPVCCACPACIVPGTNPNNYWYPQAQSEEVTKDIDKEIQEHIHQQIGTKPEKEDGIRKIVPNDIKSPLTDLPRPPRPSTQASRSTVSKFFPFQATTNISRSPSKPASDRRPKPPFPTSSCSYSSFEPRLPSRVKARSGDGFRKLSSQPARGKSSFDSQKPKLKRPLTSEEIYNLRTNTMGFVYSIPMYRCPLPKPYSSLY